MVIFIIVVFVMVVFILTHCRNVQNIVPHGATAAEALISSYSGVQEGSPESDALHYFRVKNG